MYGMRRLMDRSVISDSMLQAVKERWKEAA